MEQDEKIGGVVCVCVCVLALLTGGWGETAEKAAGALETLSHSTGAHADGVRDGAL